MLVRSSSDKSIFPINKLNFVFVKGTLMALTNTAATLPGIIVPIFVGTITHGNVSYRCATGTKRIEPT